MQKFNSIIEKDCLQIMQNVKLDPLKDAAVLVTGSNGLLGKCLVYLIYYANQKFGLNCKLYCASLHGPAKDILPLFSDKNLKALQVDLSQPFKIDEKVDFIFHAAGYAQPKKFLADKMKTIRLNVDAVQILLEKAAKDNAKFLFFSSGAVYGVVPDGMLEIPEEYNGNCSTLAPRAVYGEAKRIGETICSFYRADRGVQAYLARIGYVYGPGISIHDYRLLGKFIQSALVNKKIEMNDDGSNLITYGYIADIIQMLLNIILYGKDYCYNVAGQTRISFRQLAEEVAKCCGGVPVLVPPKVADFKSVGTGNKGAAPGIKKYVKEFGNLNLTGLSEAVCRVVTWNIEEFNLERV